MWKHIISGYLSFTKKERTGILVLIFLILFFVFLPLLYPFFIKQPTYDHVVFEKAISALQLKEEADSGYRPAKRYPDIVNHQYPDKNEYGRQTRGELFYFDPNLASASDWKRLGIRDKTIITIQNYLSRGGKFYKKEDIGKIWGLHKDEAERLIPYIQIKNAHSPNLQPEKQYEKKENKKATYTPAIVDINTGDTTAFIALPGIGGKLSQRIINFRDKLGGFYKVEQIGETFGLPDSTFQKIKNYLKIGNSAVKRININTATIDEMKSHPYLRYAIANSIIQYRTQHGKYGSVEDIKKIMTISSEIFIKVVPYLTVD